MSRLGKIPVPIPKGVTVTLKGNKYSVKGPKGTLELELLSAIQVEINEADGEVQVSLAPTAQDKPNLHGLYRQLLNNMMVGVSQGYEKRLQLIGVGYRGAVQGKMLDLQLGYSHPTKIAIPQGIEVKVDKNTLIIITGMDKQRVGQFAADVRAFKPPEPYKGKGIRYEDEYVRRKAGKAAAKK